MSVATYLYGIVKAAKQPSAAGAPPGLPGASPPALVQATPSLWLVTADVPLATYGPGPLEKALADLEWVGRVAVAHEQVVEHFAGRRATTLIPMKLFTMFSGPDRAVAEIAPRRRTIDRVMRHVTGAEEWGVRIVRSAPAPVGDARTSRPASGSAFLEARRQARDTRRSARGEAAVAVAESYDALARIARDTVRRDGAVPAAATPPLLDAAFLVPIRDRRRFHAAARRQAVACARASAQLTLTGPWPAYNFVSLKKR